MKETVFSFDKLNNETDSHKIAASEAHYAQNIYFKNGAEKRLGETNIVNFRDSETGALILGTFRIDNQWTLVFTGVPDTALSGKCYEWNQVRDFSDATYKMTLIAWGLDSTAVWNCCRHQDDAVGLITVCTNGKDNIVKYKRVLTFSDGIAQIFDGDTVTGMTSGATAFVEFIDLTLGTWGVDAAGTLTVTNQTGTFTAGETITVGGGVYATVTGDSTGSFSDLIVTGAIKAKYPVSFYDCLYLGNITEDQTTKADPYGLRWSKINDCTDFSDPDDYLRRPEAGLEISTLKEHGDVLILGKGNNHSQNQVWQIAPYSNCTRISDKYGPSNNAGSISSSKGFFFNDKGRILDLQGNHISEPVHTLMAGADAGGWELYGVENSYQGKLMWSTGRYIFVLDTFQQTWEMHKYKSDLKLFSNSIPGRAFSQWTPPIAKHSTLSVIEEDILSDFIIAKDGTLAMMNHFSDDNDSAIEFLVESRTDASGSSAIKKRYTFVTLQGEYFSDTYYADTDSINTYEVWVSAEDSPTKRNWSSIGTITLDANGFGKKSISGFRGIWVAIRVREYSKNPAKIYKAGVRYTEHNWR